MLIQEIIKKKISEQKLKIKLDQGYETEIQDYASLIYQDLSHFLNLR